MSDVESRALALEYLFDVLDGRDTKDFSMTITCKDGIFTWVRTSFDKDDVWTVAGAGRSIGECHMRMLPLKPGEVE